MTRNEGTKIEYFLPVWAEECQLFHLKDPKRKLNNLLGYITPSRLSLICGNKNPLNSSDKNKANFFFSLSYFLSLVHDLRSLPSGTWAGWSSSIWKVSGHQSRKEERWVIVYWPLNVSTHKDVYHFFSSSLDRTSHMGTRNFGGKGDGIIYLYARDRANYIWVNNGNAHYIWEWPLSSWPLLVVRPFVPPASFQITA